VSTEAQLIQQAFRFVLDPTAEQERFLTSCTGASRFWFNQGLALVKERLNQRATGLDVVVPWSYKALCIAFRGNAVKDELAPWRQEVVIGSYQAGLEALGRALQNYSRARAGGRRVGFPRFRVKGRSHEAVIFQRPRLRDTRHVDLDRRLGPLRSKESLRKLARLLASDPNARIMRSTVQRKNGRWVISFAVQRSAKRRHARRPNAVVGVDLGLSELATLSTGHHSANARPLDAALRTLRRLQRQLDRQRRANNPRNYLADGRIAPGRKTWIKSQRMLRTEQRMAKVHERVANLRRHQAHQLTTALTREFGVIGVETIAVKNLLRNRRLARHIADVGWRMVLTQLAYKASWSRGSMVVAAGRFYPSSKMCSSCGAVKAKLRLADRVFTCDEPLCGHVQDRDLNAACNLAGMAYAHAQAEGKPMSYVARIARFTPPARGGQVSLTHIGEHSPVKREDSAGVSPTPRGDGQRIAPRLLCAGRERLGSAP
jgi:putative transposase